MWRSRFFLAFDGLPEKGCLHSGHCCTICTLCVKVMKADGAGETEAGAAVVGEVI